MLSSIFHIVFTALLNFDKMSSKGITVYSYIFVPDYEVEFNVLKKSVRNTVADNLTFKNLEIELFNIENVDNYIDRFE